MSAEQRDSMAAAGDGGRRRRRAVGPPGATPPRVEPRVERPETAPAGDDDERLRRDRPPHHDQGV
jgi:hypothetical protein